MAIIFTITGLPATAATLSGAAGTPSGATGGVGAVTTDKAGGTLAWVVTASLAAPTPAQIIAGQDTTGAAAAAAGAQPVPGTGQQTTSPAAAGLAAATQYWFHFVQTDADGLQSNVASAAFTTQAQGTAIGTASAEISRRMALGTAPEAIHFRAIATVAGIATAGDRRTAWDESFHRLHYRWNFGDAAGASSAHPGCINLPAAHNDLNTAFGAEVAHVFTQPGTYTVSLEVRRESDGALVGTDTLQVTVADPAATFPGAQTVVVAADGTFTGAPAGATQVTSLGAALSAAENRAGNTRILLKRGESYNVTSAINISSGWDNFYLGAWGSGANPKITTSGFSGGQVWGFAVNVRNDIVFSDIDGEGTWDPTAETGGRFTWVNMFTHNAKNYLFSGCHTRRMGNMHYYYLYLSDVVETGSCVWHRCFVDGWGDYGMFVGSSAQDQFIAFLGCAIVQDPEAMMGGFNKPFGNIHAPVRVQTGGHFYAGCCDNFSRNGWQPGPTAHPSTMQPAWRLYTNMSNVPQTGYRPIYVFDRCALEGGADMLSLADAGTSSTEYGCNGVFDKLTFCASTDTRVFVRLGAAGATFRNCVGRRSGVSNAPALDWSHAINRVGTGSNYPDADWTTRLYNNTFEVLLAFGSFGHTDGTMVQEDQNAFNAFTDFVDENNWMAYPNLPGGDGDPGLVTDRLQTVGGDHTPRYLGKRFRDAGGGTAFLTMNTSFASPADLMPSFTPAGGSPLLGTAGSGISAYDDFYGTVRVGLRNRGAV
ncbi:MAG: PKD domain-containing protein [Pseudomonadota bacterium]